MYLLYSLLLTFGFVLLLPKFAFDALSTRKYITGLSERLGKLPKLTSSDRPMIWLHCVSVGETEAARPLVRALIEKFPNHRLAISTTTVTGQQVAQSAFGNDAAAIFYFPIDWTWVVRRVLRTFNPAAVLIMETELWPNLLRECGRQSIPVALINGRISQTSFGRYKLIRLFMRRVLKDLSIALMQSDQDASRICELGMPRERVLTPGNLKFDSASASMNDARIAEDLRERFGINHNDWLIVAASTHAPEEAIMIDAFKRIRSSNQNQRVRLLIAPRHPERFNEVAAIIKASGFTWSRRSDSPSEADQSSDVLLLDSIGELRATFVLADIAFIGGSIAPHGGHNVLEPAARGVCVVTGSHTHNFAAVTKALLAEDAIVQLPNLTEADAPELLASTITELFSYDTRRREIGQRAKAVCDRNTGATDRSVAMITRLIDASAPVESVPLSALHISAAK
jgi:3-deoxy-D-manno-octulosonic-acid transferase